MRRLIVLGAAFGAAACGYAADRIASELTRFGLDEARAECIGQRLEAVLTIDQLRQLAAAARAYGTGDADPGSLTPSDLVRVAGEIRDPAVPLAVVRAGAGCGLSVMDVLG